MGALRIEPAVPRPLSCRPAQFGKGIRINAICPGTTETPLVRGLMETEPGRLDDVIRGIPLRRMGRPDEIASAVLWLCSPGAAFMVGQTLMPDGGYCAR